MKNRKIIKMILVLSAALGLIVMLGGCGSAANDDLILPTGRLDAPPAEVVNSITVRGVVESANSRSVYSTLGLTVDRIYVEVGDYVEEGQVLATLSADNLRLTINQQIISAEAALRAAEVSVADAQNNYNNARRDYNEGSNQHLLGAASFLNAAALELTTVERNYENARTLYEAGAIARETVLQAESALVNAQNQYNYARTSYENAARLQQRSLEQARIALQAATTARQNAQNLLNSTHAVTEQQLEDSLIIAPASGTVTAVIAREGAIGMGLMFVIEDTSSLRIITSFREYDISRIRSGMEVTITSDATGDAVYTGIISRINPAATPLAPVVEFEAEITVTSPNTSLRIGTNARVKIVSK